MHGLFLYENHKNEYFSFNPYFKLQRRLNINVKYLHFILNKYNGNRNQVRLTVKKVFLFHRSNLKQLLKRRINMKKLLLIPVILFISFNAQASQFVMGDYELLVRADSTKIMDGTEQTINSDKTNTSDNQSINWHWI